MSLFFRILSSRFFLIPTGLIYGAWRGHLFVVTSWPDSNINEGTSLFYLAMVFFYGLGGGVIGEGLHRLLNSKHD